MTSISQQRATTMTVPCIDHGQKGNHGGYARVRHKGKTERLHRVVYCAAHGLEISEIAGKVVRHTCDNSRCINPDHLLLGTHADNMRDMVGRGRGVHPNPRLLTEAQIDEIRATCVPNGNGDHSPNPLSYAALGRKFGVNARAVREAFLHINYRKEHREHQASNRSAGIMRPRRLQHGPCDPPEL